MQFFYRTDLPRNPIPLYPLSSCCEKAGERTEQAPSLSLVSHSLSVHERTTLKSLPFKQESAELLEKAQLRFSERNISQFMGSCACNSLRASLATHLAVLESMR